MLDLALNVGTLLVILLGIVVVHESGHFLAARLLGVTVHEFGLGLPPRITTLATVRGTPITLNALPIGAFVRLEGEDGDSSAAGSFTAASLPRQLVILYAGVALNVALAILLFAAAALLSDPSVEIAPGAYSETAGSPSPARLAGIAVGPAGDTIVSVDGQTFAWLDDPMHELDVIRARGGQTVAIGLRDANGASRTVRVTLRSGTALATYGALGLGSMRMVIGPSIAHGPVGALRVGASRALNAVGTVVGTLARLASAPVQESSRLAGPIGIASTVGDIRSHAPPVFLLFLAALLAANLAVFNALPFPPLDGGRTVMVILRRAAGRRWSVRLEAAIYRYGMLALLAFVLVVSLGDAGRLLGLR